MARPTGKTDSSKARLLLHPDLKVPSSSDRNAQTETGSRDNGPGLSAPAPAEPPVQPRRGPFRVLRWFGIAAAALLFLVLTLWAVAALYFDVAIRPLNIVLACAYVLALIEIWTTIKRRLIACALTLACFAIVLTWWLLLPASNTRNWQKDLALLPHAEIEGNRVTVHNIRNCDYRTETDFDVRHYDKSFDFDKLRTADLYLVYWGSPMIAHTMVSFGFDGGDYLCVSIETRKEVGESYSAIKGFFRQYELTYVVADERDLVRLRTNYRQGEDAYLYRIQATPEQVRALFRQYFKQINDLYRRPKWYNALTSNCTTNIRFHSKAAGGRAPFDWRIILNGHGDEMLYERRRIPTTLPFSELKQRCLINARAKAADKAPDFSRLIREGVPGITP
ncbi:MAG: DUF4105 domain-containing protein [Verrucomicrobia subdivision 3 bacterium]|nr:DUF4105 domain-containing protein [Limisphaerales bacterium]